MNVNLGWLGTVLVLIVATVCIVVVLHQHGVFQLMLSLDELTAWRYCCRTPLCLLDCILHALNLNLGWLCNRHDDWITNNQERWLSVGTCNVAPLSQLTRGRSPQSTDVCPLTRGANPPRIGTCRHRAVGAVNLVEHPIRRLTALRTWHRLIAHDQHHAPIPKDRESE